MNQDKKYCPKCGIDLRETYSNQSTPTRFIAHKSPGTAALIAFIGGIFGLPGIGHIYVGKVGRGLGILIFGLILFAIAAFLIFSMAMVPMSSQYGDNQGTSSMGAAVAAGALLGFVYFIFFIWQIFNARKYAKKFNEMARTSGKEPW